MIALRRFHSYALSFSLALLAACGTERAPMAPEAEGPYRLSLQSGVADRAAKGTEALSTSRLVDSSGAVLRLRIEGQNPSSQLDDWEVVLSIPSGALARPTEISMICLGSTPAEAVLVFGPTGLEFLRGAALSFRIGADALDMPREELGIVYHQSRQVEEALAGKVVEAGDHLTLMLNIDGFSRYGIRRPWSGPSSAW